MALTTEQIDAIALKCSNSYWVVNGSRFIHDFARAIETEARRDALEEAAKVCDKKAQEARLWCNEGNVVACAAAIRKLKEVHDVHLDNF